MKAMRVDGNGLKARWGGRGGRAPRRVRSSAARSHTNTALQGGNANPEGQAPPAHERHPSGITHAPSRPLSPPSYLAPRPPAATRLNPLGHAGIILITSCWVALAHSIAFDQPQALGRRREALLLLLARKRTVKLGATQLERSHAFNRLVSASFTYYLLTYLLPIFRCPGPAGVS